MRRTYFESTWAASCVAATLGAVYSGIVALMVAPRPLSFNEWICVVLISLVLALPALVAGSAVVGWWMTKILAQRVRTNRVLIFSMAGAAMGVVCDLTILAVGRILIGSSWIPTPRGPDEWVDAALLASIPVFCLTVAGAVASLHQTLSEQAGDGDAPQRPC